MMDSAPVILMNRATPRAVLVNPDEWNAAAQRLSYLEELLLGDHARDLVLAGEYATVEEIDAVMAG